MTNNESDFAINISEGRQWAFKVLYPYQQKDHINKQIDLAEVLAQYVINGVIPSVASPRKSYDSNI